MQLPGFAAGPSARATAQRARAGQATGCVLGVLLTCLATACAAPAPQAAPGAAPEAARPVSRVDLTGLPEATTFGNLTKAVPDDRPQQSTDGVVLHVEQDLAVYDRPEGKPFAKLPATQLENPTWVPIIAQRPGWARVLLPARPNGSTGWVRTDIGRTEKARTPYLVEVDVDSRRMEVRKNGRVIGSWTVGVGKPGTPTPRGRTYVMASIVETVTDFSPIILPLGMHSETLNTYGGGPGTVALHGWPTSEVFGRASSDGCVRVPDDALNLLTTLPLGTLVLIR